jgi:hypothetical protein
VAVPGDVIRQASLRWCFPLGRPLVDCDEFIHQGQRAFVTTLARGQRTRQPRPDGLRVRTVRAQPIDHTTCAPPRADLVESCEHPLAPGTLGRAGGARGDHRSGARKQILATLAIDRVVVGAKEGGDNAAHRFRVITEPLPGKHRRELHHARAFLR